VHFLLPSHLAFQSFTTLVNDLLAGQHFLLTLEKSVGLPDLVCFLLVFKELVNVI